ncbi:MAG: DUF115 domain-containing protein, partial [Eubacterium sp.]|nr:DUF115 domain-containing protein [Eubacterium sp.]
MNIDISLSPNGSELTRRHLQYQYYKKVTSISDTMILFYGGKEPENSKAFEFFQKIVDLEDLRSYYFVWIVDVPEDHMNLLTYHHTIVIRSNSRECCKYFAACHYWIYDSEYKMPYVAGKKRNVFRLGDPSCPSDDEILELCKQAYPHIHSLWENFMIYSKKTLNRVHIVWYIIRYNVLGFFRTRGLMHNNNSLRLDMLKNSHQGERCFLIGNGPSLNGKDLDLLVDEFTFGTNMVYKIFDQTDWRPSFHCVSDSIYASKLGSELYEKVKSPLFTTERTYRRMKKKPVDTTYIHTIQSERYKVKGNIQTYCMVKATVLSLATEIAFHMGFKEIYLLGVDCTNPHSKGGHFTENYATKEVAETDINRIKTRMRAKD